MCCKIIFKEWVERLNSGRREGEGRGEEMKNEENEKDRKGDLQGGSGRGECVIKIY